MSPTNVPLRSFICVDFPDEVIKEVARIQQIVQKRTHFSGKLTELENLHITFKFLGHIDARKLNKVKLALTKIEFPTLNLKLHSVGTFNFHGKPRIVWIRVTGNIFKLQEQIDLALKNLFKPEERFMSHLTIARIKSTKSPQQFKEYVQNIKPKKIQFSINEFKLKSSNLKPGGPIYTTLKEYNLTKN